MSSGVTEEHASLPTTPWRGGYLLALALGFITVAIFNTATWSVAGRPRGSFSPEEWPFVLLHILIAGAPFGFLALKGIKAILPWLVALFLTCCLWGGLFYTVWLAARDQTGANIGMGWLMLASPLIIAGAALIAQELVRARS